MGFRSSTRNRAQIRRPPGGQSFSHAGPAGFDVCVAAAGCVGCGAGAEVSAGRCQSGTLAVAAAGYFPELLEQCGGGPKRYGGITELSELQGNLCEHCIPPAIFNGLAEDYGRFLEERRKLMASKIRTYFDKL